MAVSSRRPLAILVVEDNADAREILAMLLELEGHAVTGAETAAAAIARARDPIDVALIDIGLPDLDGYEVARQIRATPHGKAAYLVALTGHGEPEDRRRALAAGFDAHLVKPVDPDDLIRLVASRG
jgi:CheY-like chemotaxis protein